MLENERPKKINSVDYILMVTKMWDETCATQQSQTISLRYFSSQACVCAAWPNTQRFWCQTKDGIVNCGFGHHHHHHTLQNEVIKKVMPWIFIRLTVTGLPLYPATNLNIPLIYLNFNEHQLIEWFLTLGHFNPESHSPTVFG